MWLSAPTGRSLPKAGNPSAESSGGNFDVPPGGIGPGLDLIGLLPPTELTFPELERRELFPPRLREEEAEPATAPAAPRTPDLDINGGSAVDEAALADGTNPSSPGESTSGTFTTGEGDGIQALLVNGLDVTNGGMIAGKYGVLVVTGSPQTGYNWNYTLGSNTIDHPNPNSTGTNEGVFDNFDVVVIDANGDKASGALNIGVLDDGPSLTVTVDAGAAALLGLELDETVGPERYNAAFNEVEDAGGNANTDDAGPGLAQVTTNIAGGLTSLFTIGGVFGADGAGSLAGSFEFAGIPAQGLLTSLSATSGGAITLFLVGGEIVGRDTQGDTVFSIAIVGSPGSEQLQTTLFEALNHGSDGNRFDSELVLLLVGGGPVQLKYEVTRSDGDGDAVTQSATVDLIGTQGSSISFDDDGPAASLTLNAGAAVVVDESLGENAGEVEGGSLGR